VVFEPNATTQAQSQSGLVNGTIYFELESDYTTVSANRDLIKGGIYRSLQYIGYIDLQGMLKSLKTI